MRELGGALRGGLLLACAHQLLAEVVSDHTMQAIAHSNSRIDFAAAPGMKTVVENAVWSVEESSGAVIKHLRDMPWEELRTMLLDVGLYERLQEAAS